MNTAILILSLVTVAFAYNGGWDPYYCCYPPGEECCPPVEEPCPCGDIVVVADNSSSVGIRRFKDWIMPFIINFAESAAFPIGSGDDEFKVGFVVFDTIPRLRWDFDGAETGSSADLQSALEVYLDESIPVRGQSQLGRGLKRAISGVLDPDSRPECRDICVVLTDAAVQSLDGSLDSFNIQVPLFQDACDELYVVGIRTTSINVAYLEQLAGDPANVFYLGAAADVDAVFEEVAAKICDVDSDSTPAPSSSDCCPYDMPFYARMYGY